MIHNHIIINSGISPDVYKLKIKTINNNNGYWLLLKDVQKAAHLLLRYLPIVNRPADAIIMDLTD